MRRLTTVLVIRSITGVATVVVMASVILEAAMGTARAETKSGLNKSERCNCSSSHMRGASDSLGFRFGVYGLGFRCDRNSLMMYWVKTEPSVSLG